MSPRLIGEFITVPFQVACLTSSTGYTAIQAAPREREIQSCQSVRRMTVIGCYRVIREAV